MRNSQDLNGVKMLACSTISTIDLLEFHATASTYLVRTCDGVVLMNIEPILGRSWPPLHLDQKCLLGGEQSSALQVSIQPSPLSWNRPA